MGDVGVVSGCSVAGTVQIGHGGGNFSESKYNIHNLDIVSMATCLYVLLFYDAKPDVYYDFYLHCG